MRMLLEYGTTKAPLRTRVQGVYKPTQPVSTNRIIAARVRMARSGSYWSSHGPCYVARWCRQGLNRGTTRVRNDGHGWNQVLSNIFGPDVIPTGQQGLRPCHRGDGEGTAG